MHNYYTYLYNEAVFEVLEKKKGKMRQYCLRDLLPQVDRNSRYTGAETAGLIMNPWKKSAWRIILTAFRIWVLEP